MNVCLQRLQELHSSETRALCSWRWCGATHSLKSSHPARQLGVKYTATKPWQMQVQLPDAFILSDFLSNQLGFVHTGGCCVTTPKTRRRATREATRPGLLRPHTRVHTHYGIGACPLRFWIRQCWLGRWLVPCVRVAGKTVWGRRGRVFLMSPCVAATAAVRSCARMWLLCALPSLSANGAVGSKCCIASFV